MRYLEGAIPHASDKPGPIFWSQRGKENEPILHEICEVNKNLASSGLAEIIAYKWIRVLLIEKRWTTPFWAIFLKPSPKQLTPEDPCDTEFMKDIST